MPPPSPPDRKLEALRAQGAVHPAPERVQDALFQGGDFFDPRDLVQVKYEMLRRTREDGWSVAEAASKFGLSRPSFYAAKDAFENEGLPGLLPQKRGPKHPHKLTDEVVDFLLALLTEEPDITSITMAERVHERFGVSVHPRSIERSLDRRGKKRP